MFDFKLPDLGEGIHEGQVVDVLVKEGEPIAEYQNMLVVETDKAAVEIPSPKGGTVAKVNVKPGQTVKVGEIMLSIDDGVAGAAKPVTPAAAPAKTGAPAPAAAKAPTPMPAKPTPAPARPVPAPARPAASAPARPAPAPVSAARTPIPVAPARPAAALAPAARMERSGPVPAAPIVRKIAREMGIDINLVPGSGPHGRITREDLEAFGGGGAVAHDGRDLEAALAATNGAGGGSMGLALPSEELPDFSQWGPVRREAIPQIRKAISRSMTRSWLTVTRVTHGDTADVTELERNRKRLNETAREGQPKISVTAIVMKAVAAALRAYPIFNSSFDHTRNEVIYKDYIHIGVAVDTPRGLVVPVVRDVDQKSLPQIAHDLNSLAERTRQAKFDIAELRGGTFTITNVGALGGTFATPMVNYPEVAILGMMKATQQAVVRDGQVVPRLMLPLFLSFDHRVMDGADAARFTRDIVDSLENPLRMVSMG